MTARFSRAAQQSVEFARKARGHRPRLQLTEYRLNWNSSTSGVLNLASCERIGTPGRACVSDPLRLRYTGFSPRFASFAAPNLVAALPRCEHPGGPKRGISARTA